MKLPSPYKCDYCGKLKGETNHWFLLWVGIRNPQDAFWLLRWDDTKAAAEDHEHICGLECAGKALAKWGAQ